MKRDGTFVIIALIVLVIGIFIFNPDLLGQGSSDAPIFSVAGPQTQDIPTDIECESTQDCIDFAAEQGDTEGVNAKCENTCVYIIQVTIPEGAQ
jgi:hypothetical protein